ncbi:MAG: hypothetical protein M3Y58_09330 [Chloroflexota bacterium]|nr:hypothetical protein [Chloroflexota bacterium]
MTVVRRAPLLALSLIGLTIWATIPAGAATATAVLLPGQLTITDAPATVDFIPSSATDDTQRFAAQFAIGVTDATGSKAGWNIKANFITPAGADGIALPVRQSTITSANVTPDTGTAPISLFTYPRPFQTTGDTIFSAAPASGMGKSRLTFGADIVLPAAVSGDPLFTTTLVVTVASGP